MKTNRSNLESPNRILAPCNFDALKKWFADETWHIQDDPAFVLIRTVADDLDSFVQWPQKPVLLWAGCARTGDNHKYPNEIRQYARKQGVAYLDSRTNGPAIAAFLAAGGTRPCRLGSKNCWTVHHLYSGKFPYVGKSNTTHASKHGLHFTQSAGLVAIHPIADQMCDEYPCFSWLLRAMAFQKFKYDPDLVFSNEPHDESGFVGSSTEIIHRSTVQ